jgi:hypothetical protein
MYSFFFSSGKVREKDSKNLYISPKKIVILELQCLAVAFGKANKPVRSEHFISRVTGNRQSALQSLNGSDS